MKISSTLVLVVANLVALMGLASLWVDQDARWRNIDWIEPAPFKAESVVHPFFRQPRVVPPDIGIFLATLERPLFAPDRKQPPPPPPPPPPPAPDSLAGAQLLGVIAGPVGVVLIRSEGRVRRLTINQPIGEWLLRSVDGREATFLRNEESRVLRMGYASLKVQNPIEAPKVPATVGAPTAQSENFKRQLQEDEERERRVAALRAKMKQ